MPEGVASPPGKHRQITGVALGAAAAAGLFFGVGGFTFAYGRGAAYLTNDPGACANCHVMREQFDGWTRSSHHAAATCNDCHTPHDFAGKWFTKALNGWNHSFAFTTGRFEEPIRIGPRNRAITEAACRSCHARLTESIDFAGQTGAAKPLSCLKCHWNVGHAH
jgi:cytochrome c nitrite reductase small subunit